MVSGRGTPRAATADTARTPQNAKQDHILERYCGAQSLLGGPCVFVGIIHVIS